MISDHATDNFVYGSKRKETTVRKCRRTFGAVVLWQDRENVDSLWGQNQHITHKLSTNNPHTAQAHILSTVFPTFNQQIAHRLPTTPHLLFICPTQKSTYYQLKIGSDHKPIQLLQSGQHVGRFLSGDNVERMLIQVYSAQ